MLWASDSLTPWRCGSNFESIIFLFIMQNSSFSTPSEIVLRWVPQKLTNQKSTLVWVLIAWWGQNKPEPMLVFDVVICRICTRHLQNGVLQTYGKYWKQLFKNISSVCRWHLIKKSSAYFGDGALDIARYFWKSRDPLATSARLRLCNIRRIRHKLFPGG